MTNSRDRPIFTASLVRTTVHVSAALVALASVPVTDARATSLSAPIVVAVTRTPFTAARCPNCHTLVMAIPGPLHPIVVREVRPDADWGTCRGRVVRCPGRIGQRGAGRCSTLMEVIEHGR